MISPKASTIAVLLVELEQTAKALPEGSSRRASALATVERVRAEREAVLHNRRAEVDSDIDQLHRLTDDGGPALDEGVVLKRVVSGAYISEPPFGAVD